MTTTRFQTTARLFIATLAIAASAFAVASAPAVDAAGLRNSADITGPQWRLRAGRTRLRDVPTLDLGQLINPQ